MAKTFLPTTVFEEAIKRLNFIFDHCDEIIVSMSGGKDSTVLYELALRVARERGRLPIKVYWLDQEAEWQATEDYMRDVMTDAAVEPWWFQIPFRLTNSLSFRNNYLECWRAEDRERWIRPQDPISVKVNPTGFDRFHDLINNLPSHCAVAERQHVAVLVGMRAAESLMRRVQITEGKAHFRGITWCRRPIANTRVFWPIYDFRDSDIWTAIARNDWRYNRIYDAFYRMGVTRMRVSALIHETAWHDIKRLHQIEPQLYDRYIARLSGVNCFNQFGTDIMPQALPAYFASWAAYRDYLLENLIEPQHHALFRRRWQKQHSERWYRTHIKEIMVNDIDGTLNANARSEFNFRDKAAPGGFYEQRKLRRRAAAEEEGT